jgi:hypothetical protein
MKKSYWCTKDTNRIGFMHIKTPIAFDNCLESRAYSDKMQSFVLLYYLYTVAVPCFSCFDFDFDYCFGPGQRYSKSIKFDGSCRGSCWPGQRHHRIESLVDTASGHSRAHDRAPPKI